MWEFLERAFSMILTHCCRQKLSVPIGEPSSTVPSFEIGMSWGSFMSSSSVTSEFLGRSITHFSRFGSIPFDLVSSEFSKSKSLRSSSVVQTIVASSI